MDAHLSEAHTGIQQHVQGYPAHRPLRSLHMRALGIDGWSMTLTVHVTMKIQAAAAYETCKRDERLGHAAPMENRVILDIPLVSEAS